MEVTPDAGVTFRVGSWTEGAVSFDEGGDTVEARYTVRPVTGRGWLVQLAGLVGFSVVVSYRSGFSGLALSSIFGLLLVVYVVLNWPLEYFRWRRRVGEALDAAVGAR